jgi:hypothetical protein
MGATARLAELLDPELWVIATAATTPAATTMTATATIADRAANERLRAC